MFSMVKHSENSEIINKILSHLFINLMVLYKFIRKNKLLLSMYSPSKRFLKDPKISFQN